MFNLKEEINILDLFECGSRITCNPPVLDTDQDIMILVNESDIHSINDKLYRDGFLLGGSIHIDESTLVSPQMFWSFTKDELNLLITSDVNFYEKFKQATKLSTKLNLMNKDDRIILFQFVLYNNLGAQHD